MIDTCRFTNDLLQNLVDNLTELNKSKNCSKECNNYKRHNNLIVYRCNECNKRSSKSIGELIERCLNIYSMCNGDLDKFILLLKKGVYSYDYMDKWSRFNETSNPPFKNTIASYI